MIIYYTDNRLQKDIYDTAQKYIRASGLPIVSSSRKPIDFGDNEVIDRKPGYVTMILQIMSCLKRCKSDYVFFCEHDVLYHPSHFDFKPVEDDVYYYNINCWRWFYGDDKAVRHHRMISLSGMCANRELCIQHYSGRLDEMIKNGWIDDDRRSPSWARKRGFEPGTKKRRRGGYSDEDYEVFASAYPLVDIRHRGALSKAGTSKTDFNHAPKNWVEIPTEDIPNWNLRRLFEIKYNHSSSQGNVPKEHD